MLAIEAAESLIAVDGYEGVTTRQIAKEIGYSAGTLYNCFDDLDDLLWEVQRRHLHGLHAALKDAMKGSCGDHAVNRLAQEYLRYSHVQPRLWNLLVEHQSGSAAEAPHWYAEKLEDLVKCFCDALAGTEFAPRHRMDIARTLWAAVHGLSLLVTSSKLPNVVAADAGRMAADIVAGILRGAREAVPLSAA